MFIFFKFNIFFKLIFDICINYKVYHFKNAKNLKYIITNIMYLITYN